MRELTGYTRNILDNRSFGDWTSRTAGGLLLAMSISVSAAPVPVPEILHYRFDETGGSVTNHASAPPAGTETGTIQGSSLVQGGSFSPIAGELTGTGQSSNHELGDEPAGIVDDLVLHLSGAGKYDPLLHLR